MCVIKEINGIKKLLAVNKKGFLSMYALTILPVILVIISTLTYYKIFVNLVVIMYEYTFLVYNNAKKWVLESERD